LCANTSSKAAPCTWQQLPAHTQPFAFRVPEEDDESVKMSNTTGHRASAVTPALQAARPRLKRAQNTNFYSIQINPFLAPPIFQLEQNKALPFFYSIQMKSYQSPISDHQSLLANHQSLLTKMRRTP
jgi:hypothetical protein